MQNTTEIEKRIPPDDAANPLPDDKSDLLEQFLESGIDLKYNINRLIRRYGSSLKNYPVFIAGTGAVGGTLIRQLAEQDRNLPVMPVGACNTRHYLWNRSGFDPARLRDRLSYGEKTDWPAIREKLSGLSSGQAIFVDATGSSEVARMYPGLLKSGLHIATPSKLANSREQAYFNRLRQLAHRNGLQFRYETTVGAGLPVISTLHNLQRSGDTVTEITGAVSGTLTFLFNRLHEDIPFSQAVIEARKKGYAEPDPRDDLSGEDVLRKFLTLARTIGLKIEREEVEVESLIPNTLLSVDRDTFLEQLPRYDEYWVDRIEEARKNGQMLSYRGTLSKGRLQVGIQEDPPGSAAARLKGTDNHFRIYTERYADSPIVIQGPGAGKEVTAAGLLADILKISDE